MSNLDHNYEKAYLREKAARDELERLLEDKTRALFNANRENGDAGYFIGRCCS